MVHYPRRPPRLTRVIPDPLYFVTFNTHKRACVLDSVALHEAFRAYCGEGVRRGIGIGRYVVMPDHIHVFIRLPPEGPTLAKWIQGLKAVLGRVLKAAEIQVPHWQEGFFDHILRSDESYSEKWRYVMENPVRAGLVEDAMNWPYQGEFVVIDRV